MTPSTVRQYARLIPPSSPYFRRLAGTGPRAGSWAHLLREAVLDPRFGCNFVLSFCETRQAFPGEVTERVLVRAYRCWTQEEPDPAIDHARHLDNPSSGVRAVLRALLLVQDIELSDISLWLALPAEVVEAFSVLFFDVSGRGSPALARVVYPNGRGAAAATADQDQLLLRLAYEQGATAVLKICGYLARGVGHNCGVDLRQEILNELQSAVRWGEELQPALLRALSALPKTEPKPLVKKEEVAIGALSVAHSVMDTICKLRTPDPRRLREEQTRRTSPGAPGQTTAGGGEGAGKGPDTSPQA